MTNEMNTKISQELDGLMFSMKTQIQRALDSSIGKNLIPSATHFELIDHFEKVSDEDSAHRARYITRSEGMFVGYTSGAAMQAVHQLATENYFDEDSLVVVVFPDHGSRYMSKIYSEDWMADQGFFDTDNEPQQTIEYIDNQASKK